jgi:zinc finger protein
MTPYKTSFSDISEIIMAEGFIQLNAEEMGTIIESWCSNCHENGTTHLLLASIPYFKDVILASFRCDHCGFSNSEV